jgi:LAS superfamily LD-carboxypeptidase LdcB
VGVIEPFTKMQKAAIKDGIDIQICSSFRDFDKQLSIWNRKWLGELPLLSLDDEIIDPNSLTETEKIHAIMLWSALPGASRHHWGTDFDIYDKNEVEKRQHKFRLVPSEYEEQGPCGALSNWISKNASNFGFYLPYRDYVGGVAREPWHLSHEKSAKEITSQFAINALYAQLEQTDILGKNQVLICLEDLVHQYTFNLGPKK